MRDLYTRALYKIFSQGPQMKMRHLYTRSPDIPGRPRSLHTSSLQDLFTRPLSGKTPMRGLYTRSPDISGPPGKTSMKDLFTRAPYKISSQDLYETIQDLLISFALLGLFTELLESSSQDIYERSLYKSSLQDLFHRTPMRDLYRSSLQ